MAVGGLLQTPAIDRGEGTPTRQARVGLYSSWDNPDTAQVVVAPYIENRDCCVQVLHPQIDGCRNTLHLFERLWRG